MTQAINNLTTALQASSKKYNKVSESDFKDSLELHGIKLIYDGGWENKSL